MQSRFKFLFFTLNLILLVNGDQIPNKIQKQNFIKQINGIYSDFVSGKFNDDVLKLTKTKSNGFDTERCDNQLEKVINLFNNESDSSEPWAIEMFDAWGKIPEGILYGNTYSLGNFDQCLQILHNSELDDVGLIKGQYCLAPISIDLAALMGMGNNVEMENLRNRAIFVGGGFGGDTSSSLVLMIGMCIPATCEPTYFFELLENMLNQANVSLVPVDPESLCNIDNPIELSTADIFAITIFAIVIVLMITSTVYDVYTTKTKQTKSDLLMAFSVVTNGRKLFSFEQSKSSEVMHCLNGIRVLSLVWVIFGHAYVTLLASPVKNMLYLTHWIANAFSMFFASGTLSVDSFFLMSGLLVTYNVFKELRKTNGKLNIPMMYLHRYLRLTPAYAMTALFSVSFIIHTGLGPFSKTALPQLAACENWWWTTLLYIQNYVNPEEMCILQSWYLQVDMQLFVLSPLILIPLWKWGRNVLPVIFGIIFLSVGCYFATFYVNNFAVALLNGGADLTGDAFLKSYYPTHVRMGTWMLGVVLAYAIIKTKDRKLSLPGWFIYGAWFIAVGTLMAAIFGQYHINQPGYVETALESSLYSSLHRMAWCTGLSWIIFACVKGYGGYINLFLSHPVWLPLTRLSYSMYLLSFVLQTYRTKIIKTHAYFSDYSAFYLFWGDFGITLTVSIFWVLAFESPIPILEKVIFGRKPKPKIENDRNSLGVIEVKS